MTDVKRLNIWSWLPTLYVAEALPYVAVNVLTVYFYTKMGVGPKEMAFFTGCLYLPWVIKPFWSPFVDIIGTKRGWVIWMQLLMGLCFVGVALSVPLAGYFIATLIFFWIIAFFSATHDIAADGYYMLELTNHEQAAYVGVRSTFYRIGSLLASGGLVWLAGRFEHYGMDNMGDELSVEVVSRAWGAIFWILALFFIGVMIYHLKFMPHAKSDVSRKDHTVRDVWRNLIDTFTTFFAKPHIISALAFMLLYRLPEALCVKLVGPFMLASRNVGGLGMTTEQVGLTNGITGVVAILAGGILGGVAISKGGLKKWLWPMAGALTLPCVLYCVLAYFQPSTDMEGLIFINVAVFVEQFGYGFGFTAFMMYLIYFSEGEWKTAHYAFCTAFMALGMMLPGMAAGWIYETLESSRIIGTLAGDGYLKFFWVVVISSIATAITCLNIKISPTFGKKQ